MTINFSNSMVGLSLLSGNSSLFTDGTFTSLPSAAVLKAKAAFTTPATTAPWNTPSTDRLTPSQRLAQIKAMRTIIDPQTSGNLADMADVQTTFTSYKALASLELLAEKAARASTSPSERASLNASFLKGMADLKSYLATAPSDLVNLYFDKSATVATSVTVPNASTVYTVPGKTVVDQRADALPDLTGNEVFSLTLSRASGLTDTVTIDLSQGPQPPTLDSVTAAFNAAIQAVPMRDLSGNVVLDGNGDPVPRWYSKFTVQKEVGGGWGMVLDANPSEKVAIDQVGGKDALMVVAGQTGLDAPGAISIMRFDRPDGTAEGHILGSIGAVDRQATEEARLSNAAKAAASKNLIPRDEVKTGTIYAPTTTGGIVTDAQGYSYVVGTTEGDLGANLSDGGKDLYLTKLDGEGHIVWQQTLGLAADTQGAAVSLAPNGDIVVAGTVQGEDSDMLVARFQANGTEVFSTSLRRIGNETASAVAVGADGSIYVGGQASSDDGGDAYVLRLDAAGKVQDRRTLDGGVGDRVTGMAMDQNGDLLVLWRDTALNATLSRLDGADLQSDLGSVSLGVADARAIAVSDTGEIAVAGATRTALSGSQVNSLSGGMDGFITRIDAALGSSSTTYVGTAGEDQVDSVTYMNGALYVGGRTNGALGLGGTVGAIDGFVSRINDTTGAVENSSQFGRISHRTEPVRIAAAQGGDSAVGALGFARGTINSSEATTLSAQTSLRDGDSFSISLDGGRTRKIMIEAGETMKSLARKISTITGKDVTVSAATINGSTKLEIRPKTGHRIELIGGPDGKDALAKLGLSEMRIMGPKLIDKKAPVVTPGGTYSLSLSTALNLGNSTDAAYALKTVQDAMSMTQTAYRSLYWDATKETRVNNSLTGGGSVSAYDQQKLANYQAALTRLTGGA